VLVALGSVLGFGTCRLGWPYLAVAGGFEVPRVSGQQGLYLRGGFGGSKLRDV
jgi:antagonist of KipI